MQHIHLEDSNSYENYLKKNIESLLFLDSDVLISSFSETKKAFSFTLHSTQRLEELFESIGHSMNRYLCENHSLEFLFKGDTIFTFNNQKVGKISNYFHNERVVVIDIDFDCEAFSFLFGPAAKIFSADIYREIRLSNSAEELSIVSDLKDAA